MDGTENNVMKRKSNLFITIFLTVLVFMLITGCEKPAERTAGKTETDANHLKIVAAIFPAYDWTRNVLGENPTGAQLTLLVDNGVDLHSYQPSVDDILMISNADLFIYVGGESDQWVTDALKQAANPDIHILKMIDVIGEAARMEESVEGMQAEDEEEDAALDEHIWLSLRNAAVITDAIAAELSALDPDNAETYSKNAAVYREKLDYLDAKYQQTVASATVKPILSSDSLPPR